MAEATGRPERVLQRDPASRLWWGQGPCWVSLPKPLKMGVWIGVEPNRRDNKTGSQTSGILSVLAGGAGGSTGPGVYNCNFQASSFPLPRW